MLEHREPDPRDDIYALACITCELLTGRHPFDRLSAIQAREAGMKLHQPKSLGRGPWRALKAALSLDRETRTPAVARFLKEMNGERPAALSVTLLASGLTMAALVAAGLAYYWQSRTWVGREPAVASTASIPSTPPATSPTTAVPRAQPQAPDVSVSAVTPLLASVPCSALYPAARGHAIQVEGDLPKRVGSNRLKDMLSGVPGAASVDLRVQEVGDDECSVIKTFARYWLTNRQAGGAASMHTRKRNTELTEGDPLVIESEPKAGYLDAVEKRLEQIAGKSMGPRRSRLISSRSRPRRARRDRCPMREPVAQEGERRSPHYLRSLATRNPFCDSRTLASYLKRVDDSI